MEITTARGRSRSGRARPRKSRFGNADPLTRAFLLAAFLIGGAGLNSPAANTVIVLLGLAVLAVRLPRVEWRRLDLGGRFTAGMFLASAGLCLLQLIPLPLGLWAQLPGHQLAAMIATAVGGTGWRAWSLSPDRTIESLTALVPATAAVLIAAQATTEQRRDILRWILLVAVISAALGIIQFSVGPGSAPVLFDTRHRGFGVGLFVNRNHCALFLLLAMQLAALPGIPGPFSKAEDSKSVEWGLRAGTLVLLSLGVLSTLSRTGAFLLPVALVAAILINRRGRLKGRVVLIGAVLAALFAFALRWAPPVQALFERYATSAEDKRFEYWGNTLLAVRDSLPLGTGFGTFTLIYPTVEPLDQLQSDVVNHAHNDLLELLLEGGLPGVALLLAWLALVVFLAVRARRLAQGRRERLLPVVVAVSVALTLAASLVDYPIRMNTIAVSLALLVGMLVPILPKPQPAAAAVSPWRRLVLLPLLLLGVLTLSLQAARQFASRGGSALAPWSSQVQGDVATQLELSGNQAGSSIAARRALAVSPLDAQSLRAEGMAAIALGRREQGAQLLSLGGRLGWRDAINQLWLVQQALAAGADGFAIQRMDGLIRQEEFVEALLPMMPTLLRTQEGSAALAEQLALQPGWRHSFFNAFARDANATMPQLLGLARRLDRAKAPLTAQDTSLIRAVLASRGRYMDVRRLWQASGQTALLGDGEFEASSGELPLGAAPYEWFAGKLTGVRVETAQAQVVRKGQALAITSGGLAAGPALAQTVVLAPGRYTLSFSVMGQDLAVARQLTAAVSCRLDTDHAQGEAIAVPLTWRGRPQPEGQIASGSFAVPAACRGQTIMLAVPQTGGRPFSVWIDGVSIRSAASPRA
jgi:O-antigen ligase